MILKCGILVFAALAVTAGELAHRLHLEKQTLNFNAKAVRK
jgi:hypothetical protein